MAVISYREALRAAMREELKRDDKVVIMGEEVAQFNGAYKVTEGLLKEFGPKRIVDTPISEAGFIGLGIGASMLGIRPVMELRSTLSGLETLLVIGLKRLIRKSPWAEKNSQKSCVRYPMLVPKYLKRAAKL